MKNSITDIPGIKVGHAQNEEAVTGCTVILTEAGAVAGVDQRGGGPGTRETDLLKPENSVSKVHAIVLSGGSAFGLDSASGVVRYLEAKGIGYDVGVAKVPIVPAAILFDLNIGSATVRPDAEMGYQASLNASDSPPLQGSVGAGMGATVGKLLGMGQSVKGGIGSASIDIGNGIKVGALIAVNALGDVIDPENGNIIAGARTLKKGPIKIGEDDLFANSLVVLRSRIIQGMMSFAARQNTVIGVVATNAILSKAQATKVAQMAQNGVVRSIRPANTLHDGDTIFCLSTGKKKADVNIVGAFAAQAVAQAILNGVKEAKGAGGIPSVDELK